MRYDRGPLRPGQVLTLQCRLRAYRGAEVTRTLELPLPRDLARETDLTVVVGTPDAIETALGQPAARRARGSDDLEDWVRWLDEHGDAR